MKRKIAFTLSLLVSVTLTAQQLNTKKLDSLLNVLDVNKKAQGSVAISKNGKLLYSKAIGFVDAGKTKAANSQTKYRIGSISKMFTAVVTFQLIEEKKLTLDTKLSQYFPQIKNAGKITIGNMLYHRSGIHNITDDSTYEEWCDKPVTQKEMLAKITAAGVDFEPDTKTSYSNSNYILLAYIIEKITRKTYTQNIQQRITTKLKLANTFYGGKINHAKNEAGSFVFQGGDFTAFPYETDMSVPSGAGAIVSTPADLTVFIHALFNGKLVKASSLAQMKTIKDGLGMGMFTFPFYDRVAYGHNGGIDGFSSNLAYFIKDSIAVSYTSNGTNYGMNDILIGLLSICFNKDYSIPDFNAVANTADIDFKKYTGVYAATFFPMKITITTDGKGLSAQATGQSSFQLDYKGKDTFGFDLAGIELIFNTEKEEVVLKQSGHSFTLKKEK